MRPKLRPSSGVDSAKLGELEDKDFDVLEQLLNVISSKK